MKHFIDIVFYKAFAELRAESSRAMAGYLWWMLEPLMTLSVYYFLFRFLRPQGQEFAVFLFTGIVFWRWFNAAVMRSASCLIANRGLMLQVDLRKTVFPLSAILADSVKFVVTFILLLLIVFMTGGRITIAWLGLPVLLITQFALIIGCAFLVAGVTPLFPDFMHILTTLMMLMMFCSGIFYPLEILPQDIQEILMFNPMAALIVNYRNIFLEGVTIDAGQLALVWLETVILFSAGFMLLHKFDRYYPKIS